ncbi:unnamed protein product [Rotaria magnacalcarata]|nr:unnamed protein product [Rotaria magnacalcarata]
MPSEISQPTVTRVFKAELPARKSASVARRVVSSIFSREKIRTGTIATPRSQLRIHVQQITNKDQINWYGENTKQPLEMNEIPSVSRHGESSVLFSGRGRVRPTDRDSVVTPTNILYDSDEFKK